MRNVLLVGAALSALSLTGCDIYFGPSSNSDCGFFEPCDTWPDQPPPAPGGVCDSDYQCNAGCVCQFPDSATNDANQAGTCVETGFCDTDRDCPSGYVCQLDRATCAPASLEPPPDCVCADGTLCDPNGQCTQPPPLGCVVNADCGPGFECAPDGTCQPVACAGDEDCLSGCACQTDTGICQETGFCNIDADCPDWCDPATGECTPTVCDEARGTCTFGESPVVGSCGGPLTCAQPAPTCAAGETAEIIDGCYTGSCLLVSDCDVPPLATCDRIQNVNQCINRPDCQPSYEGMDCTCGGAPCDCADPPTDSNGNPLECTCSIWEYSCESI